NSSSKVVRDRADLDRVLATQHRAVNEFLTAIDVSEITRVAAEALDATTMHIAVTDREGQVLAVFRKPGALLTATATGNFGAAVPIFKNGQLVGGIGVTGVPGPLAEFAAFAGSVPSGAFGPRPADPGVIFLDGIALPFVAQATRPPGTSTGVFPGLGVFDVGPQPSPRGANGVADGWLIGPFASTELTQAEVTD